MKNWKTVLLSMSLSLIVFGSASARADEAVKPTAGEICLHNFYTARDAVAAKYGITRGGLLNQKQFDEIKLPANCTMTMVTAEMQLESSRAIAKAIGDSRPLGVPESLWNGEEGPAFSDNDVKNVAPQAIGPQGVENLEHALGLATGLPPVYRAY